MNSATIRPLLVSTKRVFDKMLEFPCRIGKPAVVRSLDETPNSFQSIVRITGSQEGYLVLTFPEEVADIAATLLDVSDDSGAEVQYADAANLIARLIATVGRRCTTSTGMKLKAVSGSDPEFTSSGLRTTGPWLVAPFFGRFGKVPFALSMKPAGAVKSAAPKVAPANA